MPIAKAMDDCIIAYGMNGEAYSRYRQHGLAALTDRSRRPVRYANQLPQQVESLIVNLKRDKPHWGARKIRDLLVRRLDGDVRVPAKSTIHAVLDRHGLVHHMSKRRNRATGTPLSPGVAPNDLWCADYRLVTPFKIGIHYRSLPHSSSTPQLNDAWLATGAGIIALT